jgi:hypothetical protein
MKLELIITLAHYHISTLEHYHINNEHFSIRNVILISYGKDAQTHQKKPPCCL